MEGALCLQFTTDGEGSVSAADSRRLTPAPTSLAPSCPVQALPAGCFPPKEATTDPPRNSLLTVALPQLKISLQCFQTYLVKKISQADFLNQVGLKTLPQLKISLQCFQTYLVKKICLGDE